RFRQITLQVTKDLHAEYRRFIEAGNREAFAEGNSLRSAGDQKGFSAIPTTHRRVAAPGRHTRAPGGIAPTPEARWIGGNDRPVDRSQGAVRRQGAEVAARPPGSVGGGLREARRRERAVDLQLGTRPRQSSSGATGDHRQVARDRKTRGAPISRSARPTTTTHTRQSTPQVAAARAPRQKGFRRGVPAGDYPLFVGAARRAVRAARLRHAG